jgi:hypothetical protein
MKLVPDRSGRFTERPFYTSAELDAECEELISEFLARHRGRVEWPVRTDDLVTLLEEHAESVDLFADLAALGSEVEGVTDFYPGKRPRVRISKVLSAATNQENRLRTTLTHELGHVHLHRYLFEVAMQNGELFGGRAASGAAGTKGAPKSAKQAANESHQCRRETILDAKEVDWMEWQAGYACGAFLMPRTPLRALVRGFGQRRSTLSGVIEGSEEGEELVAEVVSRFAVSRDAARIRLIKIDAFAPPPRGQLTL